MKKKDSAFWGLLTFFTLVGAIFCAIIFFLGMLVLALIIKPIKMSCKGMVFTMKRSWNWLRAPLNY